MNKTNNTPNNMKKEKRGLRKKLYAALCMLLVCTTLLTTATYAWLSLSVAPAVEKVKTTITGNGSLEIALATTDVIKNLDLIDDFESLTGFDADGNYDSKANANWGNLVDLSDDKYGLSLLKLYPALLNIVGGKVGDNPLKIANFGADGRVTFLNADTTSAMYDTNTGAFLLNGTGDYGVRALGVSTSTGLWDALESALRDTKKDADNLLKEKVSVTLSGISTDASIAQYIEFMSLADANGKPTVKSLINVAEKILGTDPVEATETTEAVPGTDGLMDKLDTAVRNLILASSGYSDKYVSISADEMLEKVESDVSTVELIENYVIDGTDLANLCDYYMIAANRAEQLQAYYEILLTKASNETGTQEDLEIFGAPIFGDSFNTSFSAWINRTVTVEKTVETVVNGQTVEKTVTETVVTHEGEIISAPTLAELDAMITALEQPAQGEIEVVSCKASNKTKNIDVLDTDNLLSAVAQIAGTFGSSSTSIDALENNFLGKPLMVVVPCNSEKCAIDQLSSVEKEFAYQESLYTLQTMWNELDIHRNALAAAIDGEMTALTEIVRSAKYFRDYNKAYDSFEQIIENNPDKVYQHSLVRKANYTAPRSASHDKLQAHIDSMQGALDFYYDFVVQSALTYASKETTSVDAYIDLTNLLATEEGVRTIPLADILAAVGNNFATEYSAAISSYNKAKTAVANAQQIFDDYNTVVEEEIKAAEKNGTTPMPHPTWEEDLWLRSAFTDITPFSEYITATEPMVGTEFDVDFRGGIVYDLINLGLGRVPNANYYYSEKNGHNFGASYGADNNSGVDYFNSFTKDPALYLAWVEMTDQKSPEGAQKFKDILRPIVTVYDEYNQIQSYDVPLYETADSASYLACYHQRYKAYDINELWAMGYKGDETYDQYDVNSIRETYTALKNTYLPKANKLIHATVENYLMETGLVNDDGITITDAQGNVAMTTSVKTILKGIIDTVFADATKPMADRIEAELKTAIGNVAYAEFRMYADGLTYAMSDDHQIWTYIMEAAAQYDAVLTKMADLDIYLKAAEAKFPQEIVWEDISPLVMLVTGEPDWGRYYYNDEEFDEYTFYLSEDSVFTDLVCLYSDKFEYETYHRGGNWRYTPYNLDAPLPELTLGLSKLTQSWEQESYYDPETESWLYEDIFDVLYLYVNGVVNGHTVLMTDQSVYVGTYRNFFIRAAYDNYAPDNGITPLYNLAVNGNKSVQTDRSLMFRNLVKEMKLAKASAEESKHMINLNTLTEYIGKTMYKGDYEYVDEDFKLMTLNDLGQSMVATKLPETLPETFTYDEVEMLITTLDGVTDAMNSYKASLRTAFMLWASSANGTKAAYKAVAANYTGTLDDMMADAKLSAGNVYYDAYNYVQQILDKTQQSRELLVTIMAGKPETVTENDTVQAATLKQALLPLAGQLYWGVYGSTSNPFDRVALYSDDSVMGYIYALYIPYGGEYYSVQLDNSYYNIRFRAPATNLMQQAINTAVEGGITFDANVSANTYANAILSDSYAFAIDILLRTNAIDSNVLLQTEEMQRIYNEEFGDVETMGKGSYLKYTLTNESQRQQMSQINDCVRVVFTDTNTGEILAVAKPDALEVPELSYEEIYGDNPKEDESKYEEIEYVGYLHLCDYTITDSGILYVGDKLDSAAIMPLERNKTTPVTVYVYLDGNDMTNAVASATEHINFDMNLQFASDAELVPAHSNLGGSNNDIPSTPANPTPDTPSGGGTTAPDATIIASGECGDNVTWALNREGTLTISGSGRITKTANSIEGGPWREYKEQIYNVVIEQGITRIDEYAFSRHKQLISVTIPDSVISIEDGAFRECTSLLNIIIPNGVTSIEFNAFIFCDSLATITIRNSLISVGGCVFRYCDSLETVYYYGTEQQWNDIIISSDNDPLLNANIIFMGDSNPVDIVASGDCGENVTWALNRAGTLTISGSGDMEDYMSSASTPWYDNKDQIKNVVFEEGVTSVGSVAFSACESLINIMLPISVERISESAFASCSSLKEIKVNEENINYFDIDGVVYSKDKTTLIAYPAGKTATNYDIPYGVTSIGNYSFYGCTSLTDVTIPDSVTTIGNFAFDDCDSLMSITIPNSVTSIGRSAFYGCDSLMSITIPEGVTTIDDYAFYNCKSLTYITIPATVKKIEWYAFDYCKELKDVYYNGTEQQWNSINIDDNNYGLINATIHYAM